jgi:hypothetical protein
MTPRGHRSRGETDLVMDLRHMRRHGQALHLRLSQSDSVEPAPERQCRRSIEMIFVFTRTSMSAFAPLVR